MVKSVQIRIDMLDKFVTEVHRKSGTRRSAPSASKATRSRRARAGSPRPSRRTEVPAGEGVRKVSAVENPMDFHYEFVQHINFDQFDGYLEIDAFFINFDRNFMINQ